MSLALLFLWILIISFGPAYNVVGDYGLISILIIYAILIRKIAIKRNVIFSSIIFLIFIGIKSIGMSSSQALSAYHSSYAVVLGVVKLVALFVLLPDLYAIDISKRKKFVDCFVLFFHVSVLIGLIMLFIHGRNTYRDNAEVGGYILTPQFFVTLSVFMIMALLYISIKQKKKSFYIALIILDFIYIFMSNYTTQMLFALFGGAMVLVGCSNMKKQKKTLFIVLMMVLLLVSVPALPELIRWTNNTFFANNSTVSTRLYEIEILLRRGDVAGTDLMGRVDRVGTSINTFKKNIAFGVPFSAYNTTSTGLIVGGHSEWPDDLARYGIFGCVLFIYLIYNGIKKIINWDNGKLIDLKTAFILVIAAYGFANPIIRSQELELLYLIVLFVDTYVIGNEEILLNERVE